VLKSEPLMRTRVAHAGFWLRWRARRGSTTPVQGDKDEEIGDICRDLTEKIELKEVTAKTRGCANSNFERSDFVNRWLRVPAR
jgi:hypothetical protein